MVTDPDYKTMPSTYFAGGEPKTEVTTTTLVKERQREKSQKHIS